MRRALALRSSALRSAALRSSAPVALHYFASIALAAASLTACIPDVVPDPSTLPQCESLDPICGADGKADCCAADSVAGGSFERANDDTLPARVSTFRLDRYEVTVGRFRAFARGVAYHLPRAGDGASPALGDASGWDPAWDAELPADEKALETSLQCDQLYARWTSTPGTNEDQPINCVSWYLAFAFCAWDGGRLPTEAEWNYAAAAGNEQRLYPWGDDAPDDTRAVFGCPSDMTTCTIPGVGSRPDGKGKWGQMDLSGSMAEWSLDYFGVPPTGCDDDCALLEDGDLGRVLRGGDFTRPAEEITTTHRVGILPEDRQAFIGLRCARDE